MIAVWAELGMYWPYTTNPLVPYCYFKLVINIIRAVKINFWVIPLVYGLISHGWTISIQVSNHPVYNAE
jgi:hypothetical protein